MNIQLKNYASGNSATGTQFFPIFNNAGGSGGWTGSENRAQTEIESPGVLSNLTIYLSANTITGTGRVRTRINSANGNLDCSYTTGVTGYIEDTSNTDTFDNDEKVCYAMVGPTTVTALLLQSVTALWAPTTGTVLPLQATLLDFNGTTTDQYFTMPCGPNTFTTTEANHQINCPTAAVLENFWTNNDINTRTGGVDDVIRSRINGANGNIACTLTRGATAEYEDLTNTDTLAAGDLFGCMFDAGATSGRSNNRGARIELSTTDCYVMQGGYGTGSNAADTFLPIYGSTTRDAGAFDTEAWQQCRCDVAFTWSDLWAYSSATGTLSIRSRINGADGNQVITWTAELGEKIDTTNEDAVAVDDLICFRNDWTSSTPLVRALSSLATAIGGAAPTSFPPLFFNYAPFLVR